MTRCSLSISSMLSLSPWKVNVQCNCSIGSPPGIANCFASSGFKKKPTMIPVCSASSILARSLSSCHFCNKNIATSLAFLSSSSLLSSCFALLCACCCPLSDCCLPCCCC